MDTKANGKERSWSDNCASGLESHKSIRMRSKGSGRDVSKNVKSIDFLKYLNVKTEDGQLEESLEVN